jgi:2-polyprenyl-6-hydroxyphenyl methylase / 3-demethylubiquinone-9 3-methyltransferase
MSTQTDGRHDGRDSVDADEIARFAAIAGEWWDPLGKFRPLHELNPVRLAYIRQRICDHYGRDPKAAAALSGLAVLDIGCGGGLLCEPLTRQGADVTGVDPAPEIVGVAESHARSAGLDIAYRAATVEQLARDREAFDVVLAMEVIEHVSDVSAFVGACAAVVRPGGLFIGSTINRTPKSWALAIVAAERILGWLPRGTHRYDRLVRPHEFEEALTAAGLAPADTCGMAYDPFAGDWRLSGDRDVNYLISAARPAT